MIQKRRKYKIDNYKRFKEYDIGVIDRAESYGNISVQITEANWLVEYKGRSLKGFAGKTKNRSLMVRHCFTAWL